MAAIAADTAPEAAHVQLAVLQRLGGERRLAMALQMTSALRRLVAAGVRGRHPEYSAEQVRLAVSRLTLGEELFHRAFPGIEVQP
jgi:hypothetical protein